ncbi:MAG: Rrf2 family transcriptional regulator [candidate division Zixibacteria bacterium]|nr:Rrf2 family transcriptional regulator [candidate division Zixibacteria bacterium]
MSRKSDYALRAVRYLAKLPKGKLGSINTISEEESIPREFLAKILKDLTHGEILVSYQGVRGGYALASEPRNVSFLKIIEAIDGPIHLNLCTEPEGCQCYCYETCELRKFWDTQERAFKKALARQNFGKFRRSRK